MKNITKTVTLILVLISLFIITSCGHEHTEEIIPEILPTCTQGGFSEGKQCAECKEIIVAPTQISAKGHTEIALPNQAPTCTEEGYENGKVCSVCNVILTDPTPVSPRHTEEIIPKVEPDINTTGFSAGVRCSVCEETLVFPEEITLLEMEIDETASEKGKLVATITLNKLNGAFSIYYGDKNREQLTHFNALAKKDVTASNNEVTFENLILPSECEYIIANDGSDFNYFVKIPEKYTQGKAQYTFGSLSDVHVNDGKYLDGALDFFDGYEKIDFVAISGDISDGAKTDMKWFNDTIKDREYKVYTTTGNHDAPSVENGLWLEYINTSIKTDSEVAQIGKNGMDFVYIPEKNDDCVFVFFCQTSWSYPKNPTGEEYSLVTTEQLTWLEEVLEKYKDKTVLLYFHTFLSGPTGSQTDAVGNLKNPGGYAYDLPYTAGTADEPIFRNLMKKYKNVVYFSGHSHWMFELEKYNENLNVSNFDGEYCYMVHNPSVCTPRWIGQNDSYRTNKKGLNSEGWIVEVHEDSLILIPVDFISKTFYTEYMKTIPLN